MAPVSWLDEAASRFWRFGCRTVLPAVPRGGWLVVGLFGFGLVNLLFQREIWPHYPQAEVWCCVLLFGCGLLLPWQLAATARRVPHGLTGGWQLLWQLFTWLSYAAATLVTILVFIGLLVYLVKVFR